MLPKIKRTSVKINITKINRQMLILKYWNDINENGKKELIPIVEFITNNTSYSEEYIDITSPYYSCVINYYMDLLDEKIESILNPQQGKYIRTKNELLLEFYLDDIGYEERLTEKKFIKLQSEIAEIIQSWFGTRYMKNNIFGFWGYAYENKENYFSEYSNYKSEHFKLKKIAEEE